MLFTGFSGFVLGTLSGYLTGITIINLPNFLLPSSVPYWQNEFAGRFPKKKWVVFLYPVFYVGGFFGFAVLEGGVMSYVHFNLEFATSFYFVFWIVAGVGIASGVFEILTGVSPIPQGSRPIKNVPLLQFKAPWIHLYRYNHKLAWRTRVVGILRILLEAFFLVLFFLIGRLL